MTRPGVKNARPAAGRRGTAPGRRRVSRGAGQSSSAPRGRVPRPWRARWETWQPWLQPAFLVAAVALAWFGQEQFLDKHLAAGLWLWAGAALAVVLGFQSQPGKLDDAEFGPKTEAWILGGILVVAAVFRFWRLQEIPHGYFFDEAVNALEGLRLLLDRTYLPVFGPSDAPLPALHFYLNALALKLGGVNLLATKFVPAVWGVLTVAVFYFLARRVVSRPVALAGALLLAVMRWHVNFSRINFVGISTPLFGAAAVYFLLRGLETKNRWHMAFSGLAVSLGLYTYYASNLIPFVVGPYLVLQLAWDRKFLKEQWPGLLFFLGVSCLVFAPLGYFALTHPDRFFSRNNQVLIFHHVPPEQAVSAFWSNVKTTLLMFHYFGDCNGRHNLPEAPMLDPVTGVLFGLGLIWSLAHLRRRHAFLMSWWLLVALVPGFLTIEAPQGYRCIGAIIPVALLSATGLERIWQGARELVQGTRLQAWLWVGLLALGAGVGAVNARDYFDRQANHVACWSEFSASEAGMGERIHELGGDYHAYISAGSFNYPTIRFLGYPHLDSEPFQIIPSIPSNYAGDKNLVYLLLPIHDGALEVLRYYYPQGREEAHPSPYDYTLFTEYLVPHAQVMAGRGLLGSYQDALGRRWQQQDGQVAFRLEQVGAGHPAPVVARWTGSLRTSAWDEYRFRLQGAAEWQLRLDGERVPPGGLKLPQGVHAVEITARLDAAGRSVSLLWQRGYGPWNLVPGTELTPRNQVHGLTGTYFRTGDWEGQPWLRRVDPLLALLGADFPLSAPFSVRWQGFLTIPREGLYSFGAVVNEGLRLSLDGQSILEITVPDQYRENSVRLTAGRHAVRIDYQKKSGAYPRVILYWTPPGKAQEKIPFTAFSPR